MSEQDTQETTRTPDARAPLGARLNDALWLMRRMARHWPEDTNGARDMTFVADTIADARALLSRPEGGTPRGVVRDADEGAAALEEAVKEVEALRRFSMVSRNGEPYELDVTRNGSFVERAAVLRILAALRASGTGTPAPTGGRSMTDAERALYRGILAQRLVPDGTRRSPTGERAGGAELAEAVAEAVTALRRALRATVMPVTSDETPPLRDALIGQCSDAAFWTQWEGNKAALVRLLDAIDAASQHAARAATPAREGDGR